MNYNTTDISTQLLCEPDALFSKFLHENARQQSLFKEEGTGNRASSNFIRVAELFAGVGGFRIGLERASSHYRTIWSNQWEPSTKRQDASLIYCRQFGEEGHSNEDITTVSTDKIPDCDLLCGGFPCQDYSVATTLTRASGIEGKKGVLWWQIYRILSEKGEKKPPYLMLENVDRLVNSPATQRGRDFAIILSTLSDLGYIVEWRIINAAEYGMPQRRKRTYIVAYLANTKLGEQYNQTIEKKEWLLKRGIMAEAFPCELSNDKKGEKASDFTIEGSIPEVSENFNKGVKESPFLNAGVMCNRRVISVQCISQYKGPYITLGDILVDENQVPADFFISEEELKKWIYQKGSKSLKRVNKSTGFEYNYNEGAMAFPDYLDRASRTIITGEGGAAPSRFKHVVETPTGRYRRLVPVELERLNMFPDHHTEGVGDLRRAFLMGNALVTGIVECIGIVLRQRI